MTKAVILAGGDVHITERLKFKLADVDLVIAADSGIRHAKPLGLKPDLIVGDFDSISSEDKESYSELPVIKHQPEKDDLDLELAIQEAQKRAALDLILVGATGSRLDQSLAAIMIAAKQKDSFQKVYLFTGNQELEILKGNETVMLLDSPTTTFSLISLFPKSILSIKNAKYPLDHTPLEFGTGLGVSNETLVDAEAIITVHSGLCVLIIELENSSD